MNDALTPTGWYQQPVGPGGSGQPLDLPPHDTGLDAYPAAWGRDLDGTPVLYRTDTLLAPAGRAEPEALARLNDQLAGEGVSLRPEPGSEAGGQVVLRVQGASKSRDAAAVRQSLAGKAVSDVALQRLYYVGLPAKDGHAGTARAAVTVVGEPPARHRAGAVPGGRRPVVALIDSGIAAHPWLSATDGEPFWHPAEAFGWYAPNSGPPINPSVGDLLPKDGVLDAHAGHGTFIAGLLRQLAPDATVLSLPLMQADGILDEHAVLAALEWLLAWVRGAEHHPEQFVDILSMSFGYFEHSPNDEPQTARLRHVLGELGSLGVRVVASAGNSGAETPVVYPAALAAPTCVVAPPTPVISVGALNPDGSPAAYSNHGYWVSVHEHGTAMVSTVPAFGLSGGPEPAEYEADKLFGGFAAWGGTSFAAAVVTGRLARALTDQAAVPGADPGAMLDVHPEAAHRRARAALQAVYPQ